MTPDAIANGLVGALVGLAVILARALYETVKRRNGHGKDWDGVERRAADREQREDIKEIRRSVDQIRDTLQGLVTNVAVQEHRITDMERRLGYEAR